MNFKVPVRVRLTPQQLNQIYEQVQENPEKYENTSHYIRVAIIQKLRRKK